MLSTKVIAELRKAKHGWANPTVEEWSNATSLHRLFISAVTLMELELGVLMAERKNLAQSRHLRNWLSKEVAPRFDKRILPFDSQTALRCALMHVPYKRSDRDAMIAATALVHGMTVVTRNTQDFSDMGIRLINPWNT